MHYAINSRVGSKCIKQHREGEEGMHEARKMSDEGKAETLETSAGSG